MRRRTVAAAVLLLMVGACSDGGAPRGTRSATPPAVPAVVATLVGAGDIAECGSGHDEATARLVARIRGTVATFGDNAYPDGSRHDFGRCYAAGWGRFRARTRPALGNHDYRTPGAAPYFRYFGDRAGGRWYSYELGAWHVVVLDSMCSEVSCAVGSPQERWLRADLAAHPVPCTLAYWHHPLYTSGAQHPPDLSVRPLFDALYDAGAEVVLTGHNHQYERFAPMDAFGHLDPARGVRSFVVGTGGAEPYPFGTTRPHSVVRGRAFGVIRLTLRPDGYDWRFLPAAGSRFTDHGSTLCH